MDAAASVYIINFNVQILQIQHKKPHKGKNNLK